MTDIRFYDFLWTGSGFYQDFWIYNFSVDLDTINVIEHQSTSDTNIERPATAYKRGIAEFSGHRNYGWRSYKY